MKKINGVILITAGVLMLAGCASPTPTPTVSPTETSSASPTPTETASPSPTSSPTPTDSVFIGIDSPAEGAMVSSPVILSGTSCIFEAQFQYKLQSGSATVKTGTIMADAGCPNIGSWSLTLNALAAGDYKFTAFARSLKDGSVIAKTVRNFSVQ